MTTAICADGNGIFLVVGLVLSLGLSGLFSLERFFGKYTHKSHN